MIFIALVGWLHQASDCGDEELWYETPAPLTLVWSKGHTHFKCSVKMDIKDNVPKKKSLRGVHKIKLKIND